MVSDIYTVWTWLGMLTFGWIFIISHICIKAEINRHWTFRGFVFLLYIKKIIYYGKNKLQLLKQCYISYTPILEGTICFPTYCISCSKVGGVLAGLILHIIQNVVCDSNKWFGVWRSERTAEDIWLQNLHRQILFLIKDGTMLSSTILTVGRGTQGCKNLIIISYPAYRKGHKIFLNFKTVTCPATRSSLHEKWEWIFKPYSKKSSSSYNNS